MFCWALAAPAKSTAAPANAATVIRFMIVSSCDDVDMTELALLLRLALLPGQGSS
jgi:hypothetical protein